MMLTEDAAQRVLHASRVIRLPVKNPHGPLGWEQLAEAVKRISADRDDRPDQVSRPIALPVETWEKLDRVARKVGEQQEQRVSASDVATALVDEADDSVDAT